MGGRPLRELGCQAWPLRSLRRGQEVGPVPGPAPRRACGAWGKGGPSSVHLAVGVRPEGLAQLELLDLAGRGAGQLVAELHALRDLDRKSTRLNSSHANISYAVFCLKKKIQPALVLA